MLLVFGVLLVLCHEGCLVAAANHHHPHPTKGEPGEHHSVDFYYDPVAHMLITMTRSTCFCASLKKDEYDHVHNDIGLDDLELLMMRQWIGQLPETKIYHDDQLFPSSVLSRCRAHDILFLERGLNSTLLGSTKPPGASATSAAVPIAG